MSLPHTSRLLPCPSQFLEVQEFACRYRGSVQLQTSLSSCSLNSHGQTCTGQHVSGQLWTTPHPRSSASYSMREVEVLGCPFFPPPLLSMTGTCCGHQEFAEFPAYSPLVLMAAHYKPAQLPYTDTWYAEVKMRSSQTGPGPWGATGCC